jgi:hypothetical protein
MSDRQLAVYDCALQPTLGEFCIFLQASLSLSAHLGIEDVDLCLVNDPSLIRNRDFAPLMTNDGALRAKIFELLPMTQLHPNIRSIIVVDRIQDAVDLARRTEKPYKSCWRPCEALASGKYMYYSDLTLLDQLHHGKQVVPRLRARPPVADWAKQFLSEHCAGGIPVTVNLRSNPTHCVNRNMDARVWRNFFDQTASRHAATFFLLGAASEDFSLFRGCRNAVVTKDWHTSVEQDLALIEYAGLHIGCCSGPSIHPLFIDDKPTLIVRSDVVPDLPNYHGSMMWDDTGTHLLFSFGSPNYRSTARPETVEFLTAEFDRMQAVLSAQAERRKADAAKLDAACAKGMELQLAGQLDLAGQLYQAVLQAAPQHAAANYCMGMLHVQLKRPEDGLPHLKTALLAQLGVHEYWLGYLETLMLLGRHAAVRNILALGLQQGLKGDAVDDFTRRLDVPSARAETSRTGT